MKEQHFEPRKLRACLSFARSLGVDPGTILEGCGLVWSDVQRLTPIAEGRMAAAMEQIGRRLPMGSGFACGIQTSTAELGLVGYLLESCATFGDLLTCWTEYAAVASHPMWGGETQAGGQWFYHQTCKFSLTQAAERFWADYCVAASLSVYRELTSQPMAQLDVQLPYGEDPDCAYLGAGWFRSIMLNAPAAAIGGMMDERARKIRYSDPHLHSLCLEKCEQQRQVMGGASLLPRVRAALLTAENDVRDIELAEALTISLKSLRSELRAYGTTLRALRNEVRRNRALQMVEAGTLKPKEICWALGFQDPSAFRRAFRKWTGGSVTAWSQGYKKRREASMAAVSEQRALEPRRRV